MPKKDVSESQNSIRVDETQSLYKKKCDGKSGVVTKLPPSNLPPLPPHRTALPKNVLTKTNKVFPEKKKTQIDSSSVVCNSINIPCARQ